MINIAHICLEVIHADNIDRFFGYDIIHLNSIFSILSNETQQQLFDKYQKDHPHTPLTICLSKSRLYFDEYYINVVLPHLDFEHDFILFENTNGQTIFKLKQIQN